MSVAFHDAAIVATPNRVPGPRSVLRVLIIAGAISSAIAQFAYAQVATPTGVAVGPWRTGVSVTCPGGRVIPANTVISGPDVTPEQLCGIGSSSSGTSSTGGAMISNTGNFKQDMLTNSVNLMIVSNTRNPVMSSFMQGAATSFISSMFANNAEAQRQQQLMAQEILRRQQEQERQRRIAEQQRLDAMFARLTSALKLEGLPFNLSSLKGMNSSSPDSLQLKGMGSSGPDDLKLKIADSSPTSYGLKGLPGIYVGGPAGGDSASSNSPGTAANPDPAAAAANPNLVSGPGSGTTGPGIPGLPGIYLDGVQPSQAPQLAQAAQTLNGPERAAAQDAALQAAQQNPTLAAPSEDPKVQSFQQATQEYRQALTANSAATQDYQTAQTHVESDRSAIDVARAQLNAIAPSVEQQQAFNQMLSAAKTDEEASMLARQNFDSTQVNLSASRDRAAAALAQTAAPASNLSPAPTQTAASLSSSTVDLTHASQPVSAPLLRSASPRGGPITASPAPASVAAPAVKRPIDIDACLAAATYSSASPVARPTADQLRKQLDVARESLARLLETHQRENENRADWSKEMKKGGIDIGYQAFDLTTKFVLGRYAENAKEEAEWAEKGFQRTQDALKTETNLARQSSLEAEIAAYQQQGTRASHAHELLEGAEQGTDQGGKLRDFRGLLNDNGGSYKDDNPIASAQKGDLMPALDGFKQTVKITLSDKAVQETLASWVKHAEYVPLIDRTVTIGGALIDTGYDLTVEYLGFYQLQQADQNSELFYRGAAPLQKKIQTTVGQLKCFQ